MNARPPLGPLRPRPARALRGPLVHLDVSASTNDRARELAVAGAPDGTVVLAEAQTAGRGRQGRQWWSPPRSSLTFSVLVRPEPERLPAFLELLPLAVPLAVCEACEQAAGTACAIKWPNDVWIGERKVAGILIESRPREGWAVVGIGLNVNVREEDLPSELRETATSLMIEAARPLAREDVFDACLSALATRLEGTVGAREALLTDYRARDVLRGRSITWSAAGERLSGVAQGVDDRGNLVVFTGDGRAATLEAGEVHLERDGDVASRRTDRAGI